ncbi:MAG: SAM-dependent methyltransferase [Actinophytocola sp.]|uniref:SAM-dependent methyltransferase n=1 Tax=Actinophytocola sp. TaxID=1872138 RepID=UPI003C75D5CD
MPDTQLTATPLVDLCHPSVARVYDYLLGGSANWAVDRAFGDQILDHFREFGDIARAHRSFVNRVVRHLVREGVRQFVDIGSGVLSKGNTHQVADEVCRETRVVYVDNEAVAVAHAEIVLDEEGDPDRHAAVNADLRYPDQLWHLVRQTGVLDLDEPVALLMFGVLHTMQPGGHGSADPAYPLTARYRELLSPGSYLGVSHVTNEDVPPELQSKLTELKRLCDHASGNHVYCRSHAAVRTLLGDFRPVGPGVGWIPDWYRDEARSAADHVAFAQPNHAVVWAGIGQKKSTAHERRGFLTRW